MASSGVHLSKVVQRAAAIAAFLVATALSSTTPAVARQDQTAPSDPEAKLAALGIQLPAPSAPLANYVKAVRAGNLVFLAGHGPVKTTGDFITGTVGRELTIEEGYAAARLTAIGLLATLKAEIGDLGKVKHIVRLFGLVNCVDRFTEHPKVINGASDLLVEVFGERGRHARAAVGAASLPFNIAVEIEMIVEVKGD